MRMLRFRLCRETWRSPNTDHGTSVAPAWPTRGRIPLVRHPTHDATGHSARSIAKQGSVCS